MHNQETGEEPDCKGIIPVGVAAGVIVGVFIGMAIAAAGGLEAYGWEIVVGLGATIIGGGVVIRLVVWALQDDLDKTAGWWRERVQHDDDIIEIMGAEVEADEQRHAAEVVRLVGEIERQRQESERARLAAIAEVMEEAEGRRQRLIAQHQRELVEVARKAKSQGYIEGVRVRLGSGGSNGRVVRPARPEGQRGPDTPRS